MVNFGRGSGTVHFGLDDPNLSAAVVDQPFKLAENVSVIAFGQYFLVAVEDARCRIDHG